MEKYGRILISPMRPLNIGFVFAYQVRVHLPDLMADEPWAMFQLLGSRNRKKGG